MMIVVVKKMIITATVATCAKDAPECAIFFGNSTISIIASMVKSVHQASCTTAPAQQGAVVHIESNSCKGRGLTNYAETD